MRKSLLVSAVLASGALLCSLGAEAGPIHVGLLNASGGSTWTSPVIGDPHGTVSLSGWEFDERSWSPATMIKNPNVPGLGVECNSSDPGCTGYQIGSDPEQIIDMDISQLTDWTGLIITLKSVEGSNTGNLYGATCAPGDDACGGPTRFLGSCTTEGSCSITLTEDFLAGITDIWVTPVALGPDPIVLGGSLYLCTPTSGPCVVPTAVPEPKALGMFGLGLLLIGTFFGLRRRRLRA